MDAALDKALLTVIAKIADKFGPEAVLKGGMALRLQGIDRSTTDADFNFQPAKSKKDFGDSLIKTMEEICDGPVNHRYDSKRLLITGQIDGIDIMVEANAHPGLEPTSISTARLARQYDMQPSIISIMPNELAFANKLGAWLDRRLARDLYDIYIFSELLRVKPDLDVLASRIAKPSYTKSVKARPKLKTTEAFLEFIQGQCDELTSAELEDELRPIIPPEEIVGLGQDILVAIRKLRL